jgi:hypothetical protein
MKMDEWVKMAAISSPSSTVSRFTWVNGQKGLNLCYVPSLPFLVTSQLFPVFLISSSTWLPHLEKSLRDGMFLQITGNHFSNNPEDHHMNLQCHENVTST